MSNFNYEYKFLDGTITDRNGVLKKIREFCGNESHPLKTIAKGINMSYSSTNAAVRWAQRNGVMHSKRIGRAYFFGIGYLEDNSCLLSEMFYNKEKILSKLKVKSVTKRKIEDAPNKSTIAKGSGVTYGTHLLNTVYD